MLTGRGAIGLRMRKPIRSGEPGPLLAELSGRGVPTLGVMVDGVDSVRRRLESRGIEVHVYDGSELSLKGDGGPTCLTCPILRAA